MPKDPFSGKTLQHTLQQMQILFAPVLQHSVPIRRRFTMATMMRLPITRWIKDGKIVPAKTAGARKKSEKTKKYYAVYLEHGKQKKVPLSTDKASSQIMLANLLKAKERGMAGLADPHKDEKQRPIEEHMEAYLQALADAGRDADYRQGIRTRLTHIFVNCRIKTISDFSASRYENWLKAKKCSARMRNAYTTTINGLVRWLIRKERTDVNPFSRVTRFEGTDPHPRRALPADDLLNLLETAYTRPEKELRTIRRGPNKGETTANVRPDALKRYQRIGHERYLIYKTAILTGLRQKELRTLKVRHLQLDGTNPGILKPGKNTDGSHGTKNKKLAHIPIKPSHAIELADWVKDKKPGDFVFCIPFSSSVVKALRGDLAACGIPYADDQGRVFDFHCFRKCTSSLLHQAKVHPRIIQLYMRHSNPNLTTHYDDAELHDLREALDKMPDFLRRSEAEKDIAARIKERKEEQELVEKMVREIEFEVRQRFWAELEKQLSPEQLETAKKIAIGK